jgi:diamine N-acetyltransferase
VVSVSEPSIFCLTIFEGRTALAHNTEMVPDQNDKITTRSADADDANLIAVLGSATFYEAYFEQDIPAALANYILESFSPDQIRQEMNEAGSEFIILFQDEKAAGYAKLRQDPPGPGVTSRNSVELQRFYLAERVWGTGLAERLLERVLGRAGEQGFDMLWLGVWTENKRAQRFYEKHGFADTGGRLEFVYDAGIGINVVMERRTFDP